MTIEDEYDIMIVGGGPAGISTWLHLHKFAPDLAAKTILIEKEKYPRDKLCGGAVLNIGQNILEQLDVDLKIPSVPIHNVKYRFGKDIFCHKEQNFLKIYQRIEFDYALAKSAITRGLQLNEGETFLNMSRTTNGLKIITNHRSYKVKALIGADGAMSRVRDKMKLPSKPRFAPAIEIFAPVNPQYDDEFTTNTSVIDFTPTIEGLQGYVWHFPCIKDNKPWMNHGICDIHIITEKPRANIKKIFARELQTRGINRKPSSWLGHPVPWFVDEPIISQPHVLLVGDAAGIEPLIGGGIHLSLWYGEVAALTILEAFHNEDFSFKNYEKQIRAHFLGQYIRRFTYLASEIYSGKMNALDAMKKIVAR